MRCVLSSFTIISLEKRELVALHVLCSECHVTVIVIGPRSPVGNVSDNRCESDCRSRGCEFDPGLVPYFREVDHEIVSMVILLPSAESFKKGCCQLQANVCARSTG